MLKPFLSSSRSLLFPIKFSFSKFSPSFISSTVHQSKSFSATKILIKTYFENHDLADTQKPSAKSPENSSSDSPANNSNNTPSNTNSNSFGANNSNSSNNNNNNSSGGSSNSFFPGGSSGNKSPKIKKRSKEMLETTSLGNVKFDLPVNEAQKKQSKYILFSSKYPILPHIKIEGMFTTGKLAAEELKHPIAFFLQNEEGNLYTTGVVFEKNINKFIRDHIGEKQKGASETGKNNPMKSFVDSSFNTENSIKSEIVTKKVDYRIKITEIEMNSSGIFLKAIKIKDKKVKDPTKVKETLQKVLELVTEIQTMEFVGKPQFFEDQVKEKLKTVNCQTISVDEVDEVLYSVATLFFKTEFYLNQKPNVLFQQLLETRSLLERIELVEKKLKALISNFNYQMKISTLISKDNAQDKILNKSKNVLASEYVKTVFGIADQNSMNPNVISQGFGGFAGGSQNKLIKSYLDKLKLISDAPSQEKVRKEIERLSSMDKHSPEHSKILTYLDEVFSIPWSKYTDQYWNITQTKDILEKNIYGLQKVKERIVEMIAVNKLKGETKKTKGFIILLYGPPGTGKTSVAKSIAKAIKRPHRFISFAGVNDPHFIKGHGRTYVDSQPGPNNFPIL